MSDTTPSFATLAADALGGSNDAMTTILSRLRPLMLSMCGTGGRPDAEADEKIMSCQEALWETILPSWQKADYNGDLASLCKVSFRRVLNDQRRQDATLKRGGGKIITGLDAADETGRAALYTISHEPDPAQAVETAEETAQAMAKVMKAAGPLLVQAIPRLLLGETAAQISKSLGFESARVSVELGRLGKKLRKENAEAE